VKKKKEIILRVKEERNILHTKLVTYFVGSVFYVKRFFGGKIE